MKRHQKIVSAAVIGAALFFNTAAGTQEQPVASAPSCKIDSRLTTAPYRMYRMMARIDEGFPIKIIALGSSSTGGAGASGADKTYPAQLLKELQTTYPWIQFTMVNMGKNGDTSDLMFERLKDPANAELIKDADVLIFQGGVNSVLQDKDMQTAYPVMAAIVKYAKAQGMDVMLMNAQAAPKVMEKRGLSDMLMVMNRVSKYQSVNLIDRFAWMRLQSEQDRAALIAPDQLHHNDAGYACLAKLAVQLMRSAVIPSAMARAMPR